MAPWSAQQLHRKGANMTTALAIIGGTAIILSAAAKIPLAVCTLIRTCIPLVAAAQDLHQAIRHRSNDEPRDES
jgi:hypothetical protein